MRRYGVGIIRSTVLWDWIDVGAEVWRLDAVIFEARDFFF